MRPAVGDFQVREAPGAGRFFAKLNLFQLPRSIFFSIEIPDSRITLPEGSGFVAVNIVSSGRVKTLSPMRGQAWEPGAAYAVNHDQHRFDFTSDEGFKSQTLCFRTSLLNEYTRKFDADNTCTFDFDQPVILNTKCGGTFSRYFDFIWNELNRGGGFLESAIATEEIEDSLLALFLSAAQNPPTLRRSRRAKNGLVRSAEEYIVGHLADTIRVADIAEAVGVSVPTLNRAFRRCYGFGPKAFVKKRRLDRVRAELESADPAIATVTSIAGKFGFWHLSQFASDYKKQFGELPSSTLRRR